MLVRSALNTEIAAVQKALREHEINPEVCENIKSLVIATGLFASEFSKRNAENSGKQDTRFAKVIHLLTKYIKSIRTSGPNPDSFMVMDYMNSTLSFAKMYGIEF